MAFESISEKHEFVVPSFPDQWLPLTHLYDPDLPLFPIYYFHVLDPELSQGKRPGERDRAFGFVHHLNLDRQGLKVTLALNKDFSTGRFPELRKAVEREVRHHLGVENPVTISDLSNCFSGVLSHSNDVIKELWYKIVDHSFGGKLPFGRLWDPLFGLARFIASWYSAGGRKGELIQTHSFVKHFGVRISTGGGIHADFYLLPTFEEFIDRSNPLSLFPNFVRLLEATDTFVQRACDTVGVGSLKFSAFRPRRAGIQRLNTENLLSLFKTYGSRHEEALLNLYNDFDRGPQRSVIALVLLADLRAGNWHPMKLELSNAARTYIELERSYQSPKVIHLYSQLCFGNEIALPIDNWVKTFLRWPLGFPKGSRRKFHDEVFSACSRWGKVERVIWIASQARKVHASVAEDTLWCIRYGSPEAEKMRGANPVACKICATQIRNVCPAFSAIADATVCFNQERDGAQFQVTTSAGSNAAPGQSIDKCIEIGPGAERVDEYSTRDERSAFGAFPALGHDGDPITVQEFVKLY